VWVPKYPLTRSSVLPAARRSAMAVDENPWTVQVVFDLRGSGESDGTPSKEGFEIDLHSVSEWAHERFGLRAKVQFFGFPDMGGADRLITMPLRPGVMIELYRYNPRVKPSKGSVLYFSQYFDFTRDDDVICRSLADKGFIVYGCDLMRYLLLAGPLTMTEFMDDTRVLASQLESPLFLVARAFAAGPALAMAAGVASVRGVLVTGPAQQGLSSAQHFVQDNPAHLLLSLLIREMASRPAIFLWNVTESGKLDPNSLKIIHDAKADPKLWAVVKQVDGPVLLNALGWLINKSA